MNVEANKLDVQESNFRYPRYYFPKQEAQWKRETRNKSKRKK